jgi:chlorobactene glucosyltransferase
MTILAALLVFAWLWALLRTLLNLALIPRLKPRQLAREPLVSIIIPARNEERAIGRTVRALLAQTYRNLELIVVDDQSTDGTARAVEEIADPRVTLLRGETPPPGWLGKPWALHQGSLRAKGELLFFVDADVFYAPAALSAAVGRMEESGAALMTLFPNFEMHGFWENVGMPQLALGAFMLIPSWLSNRTTRPSLGIGGGTGNLVLQDAYAEADGHVTLHQAVVDDVALARLIRASGRRTELVRAEDLVSIRMYHGARSIIDGFTKNFYIALGGSLWFVPFMIAFTIIVNLVPYAFLVSAVVHAIRGIPISEAEWLGCAAVALLTIVRIVLFAALRYRIDNAIFLHPLAMMFVLYLYLRSAWRTGVRREVHWRGRTYDAADTRFGA